MQDPFAPPAAETPQAPSSAVRRCRACGEAAMIGHSTQRHSVWASGVYVCQACGSFAVVHGLDLVQYLLTLPAGLFFGLGVVMALGVGWWRDVSAIPVVVGMLSGGGLLLAHTVTAEWARWRHPIVRGVRAPAVAFLLPGRQCRCGAVALAQRVAIERHGAITKFVCTACGRGFLVDDGFATVHRLALGLLLLALGAGVAVGVPPEPSRQDLVGGAIALGFGAAGLTSLWVGARRALRRSRHRLVRLEIADADP